ncbi:FG-GAP-like repeat-containing protein [Hymenobacter sp. HDW8]|uniref:FG-GAP-like repeat-containing protein n=1 Tax=Hymenobacter sp. HDW8 TaxID=2714932 RepID=UPI001408D2C5|nr:FG-GAP-like repeat-containing protein [Hymenobacter sp. HDW8]QIL78148.1 hypothetical protein G7064_20170 [Hymenobacter sp. HDW8]
MKYLLFLLLGFLGFSRTWAQALTVTSVTPRPHAVAVGRTGPIQLTFSQPLGAGANTLRVLSDHRGRLSGADSVNGNTLIFTPTQAFVPGEVVYVTVPTTIHSAAGIPLTAPQVYQFTAATSAGPSTFTSTTTVALGRRNQPMYVGEMKLVDMDSDGDLDLLATVDSPTARAVGLQFNDGQGNFTAGLNPVATGQAQLLRPLDVDGDGDLDFIASFSTSTGTRLRVHMNEGRGVFREGYSYPIAPGRGPNNLLVGDGDGDGDLDLLVVYSQGTDATLLMNNGLGKFTPSVISGTDTAKDMAWGDLDNDGDLDLLTVGSFGLSLRLNDGKATFTPVATVNTGATFDYITVADIDQDGDLDLLTNGNQGPLLYTNNGQGVFTSKWRLLVQPRTLTDMDGDGDLDMVNLPPAFTNPPLAAVQIRHNDGAGGFFGASVDVPFATLPDSFVTGDVDGDGDLDLVSSDASHVVHIRWNGSPPASIPVTPLQVATLTPGRHQLHVAPASPVVIGYNQALQPPAVPAAHLQVFSAQRGRLAGTVTRQEAGLTFVPATNFQPGERVSISATPIDPLGDPILSATHVSQFTTAVAGGTGAFSGGSVTSVNQFTFRLLAADVDNDGDQDLLSCSNVSNEVIVSLNSGNGTFPTRRFFTVDKDISDMTVADVDGDGDIDVLVSAGLQGFTAQTGKVTVCLNNGTGYFGGAQA